MMYFTTLILLPLLNPLHALLIHPFSRKLGEKGKHRSELPRLSVQQAEETSDSLSFVDPSLVLACEWSQNFDPDNERRTLDGERIYYRNGEYDSEADLWISLNGPPKPNFYDMTLPLMGDDNGDAQDMIIDMSGFSWRSGRMLDSSGLVRNQQVPTEELFEQQSVGLRNNIDLPIGWHGPMHLPPENRALRQDLKLFDTIRQRRGTLLDDERWMIYYSKLAAFQTRFGHVDVPVDWEEDPMLGKWVLRQRHNYRRYVKNNYYPYECLTNGSLGAKNNQLTPWRIQMLYDIGFSFKILLSWEDRYNQLESYRAKHGDCQVPCSDDLDHSKEEFPGLYVWIQVQRTECRRWKGRAGSFSRMSAERYEKLLGLNFDFDPLVSGWRARMAQLQKYKEENGDIAVTKQQNQELAGFLIHLRKQYRLFQDLKLRSQLTEKRIQELNELGMDWVPISSRWQERLESLRAYVAGEGNSRVPYNYAPNRSLALWVKKQRSLYKEGRLQPGQLKQLEDLGFTFDIYADAFERGIAKLKDYKAVRGDCLVSTTHSDQELVMFVKHQRKQYRAALNGMTSSMTKKRHARLEAIEFVWNVESTTWQANYNHLVRFFDEFGHTNIPRNYHDSQLYAFVRRQRELHKDFLKGSTALLTIEMVVALEAIGFRWSANEARWNMRYEELLRFKKIKGNCNVPDKSQENQQLASWVRNQRTQYKKYHRHDVKSTLTASRVEALEELGFAWSLRDQRAKKQLSEYT